MRIYEAIVIDKALPTDKASSHFESYVAVPKDNNDFELPDDWDDDQIHYYFHEQEFNEGLQGGEIETKEFKYLIGERVA